MTSTYRPSTIRSSSYKQFRDVIGHECFCGAKITKKKLAYYINENGEMKPICRQCAEIIQKLNIMGFCFVISFPLPRSKARRYKIDL